MVRLKDMLVKMGVGLASRFQFLMVRLKVTDIQLVQTQEPYFNSLWCD